MFIASQENKMGREAVPEWHFEASTKESQIYNVLNFFGFLIRSE
jgi:hypothetical protein